MQTSTLPPWPLLSQCLWRAMALHVMKSKFSMVVPADAKRTTWRIPFRCHHTHGPQLWGGSFHHTNKNARKLPQPHWKPQTQTQVTAPPPPLPPRTQMARTTHVFQRCLQDTEMKGKIQQLGSPGALRDCKEECKLSWWGEDRKSK